MKKTGLYFGCSSVIALFIGFLFASAVGALFPIVNKIAAPLVCSHGTFQTQQDIYTYNDQLVTSTAFCIDNKTGEKQDISTPTILVAGLIDSVIVFIVVIIALLILDAIPSRKTPPDSPPKKSA